MANMLHSIGAQAFISAHLDMLCSDGRRPEGVPGRLGVPDQKYFLENRKNGEQRIFAHVVSVVNANTDQVRDRSGAQESKGCHRVTIAFQGAVGRRFHMAGNEEKECQELHT